jgi:hypothetical protein
MIEFRVKTSLFQEPIGDESGQKTQYNETCQDTRSQRKQTQDVDKTDD